MASGQPPSFYHILMNPSSPHLPLPAKFVKKHLRNKILKKPILKSENGGYLWKLKMKKVDDHGFRFVNGWCNVVKDLGLLFGEFLLFRYVGSSVFLMHVYSVNGCEKILVPRIHNNFKVVEDDEVSVFDDEDDDVEDEVEDDDDDYKDVEYYVEEDDVDVELGDDSEDGNDGEDEDNVNVDAHDGDPYFIITSSKRNKNKLRFPPDLIATAKIKTKETITLKNDDGYEKEMPVRSYEQNKSTRYYVAEGWEDFQRSNNISEGDECVLKFITSEDKLCLAKVTKKKSRVTEVDNDNMEDDDGMDEGEAEDAKEDDSNVDGDDIFDDDEGKGEYSKLVNDDEDDEDDDRDVDGDDGDPSFILTSSDRNQYYLWFSADFVALAGIDTKETITLRNLDGYEKELRVRSYSRKSHRRNQSKNYYSLAAGWKEFQRNSNISQGDKFVFKFITSEDKFCVAKITKKRTPARPLPPAVKPVIEVTDGMDDPDVDDNDDMDDDSNADGDDIFVDDVSDESKGENAKHVNDDEDNVDDDRDVDGDDGDPSFILTLTHKNKYHLHFSKDFVALAGINTKKTITLKNLDGYEKVLRVRSQRGQFPGVRSGRPNRWRNYCLGAGWKDFQRNSNISEGDKFVFKFIRSEDKFCVAKITKNISRARPLPPAVKAPVTEVDEVGDPFFVVDITTTHKFMLWLPPDFVELAGIDGKKNIIIKCLDGNEIDMVLRPVKQVHSTRYCLSKGWKAFRRSNNLSEGDKCVFKYITSEDKLCLATVTKTSATEADAEPFFVVTITPSCKSSLWLPIDFVRLAGIDTKKNIIVKSLDGNETQMALRSCSSIKRPLFSKGWLAFKRSNNILEGDECVFKYITSEDKMCLAKVTKEKTQTSLPSPTEVVKRKRGPAAEFKMPAAENVKRSRQPPPVEITVAEGVKTEEEERAASAIVTTSDKRCEKDKGVAKGVDEGVEASQEYKNSV